MKKFLISYFNVFLCYVCMFFKENQKESNNFSEKKFHASAFATCVSEILLYDGF